MPDENKPVVETPKPEVQPVTTSASKPIVTPDGQSYASVDELAKAKAEANTHIQTIQEENKKFREELDRIKSGLTTALGGQSNGSAQSQFDQARYYELLNTNPVEAHRYASQFDPEYQRLRVQAEEDRLFRMGTIFLARHPNFSGEVGDLKPVVDWITQQGMPLNPDTLDAAYALMVQRGQIKGSATPAKAQPTIPGTTIPPPNLGTSAPPGVEDAAVNLADEVWKARDANEARDILKRRGIIQ